jgi:hypothetical protein
VAVIADVDVAGLERDDYSAEIEVKAANADNSPVLVPVQLRSGIIKQTGWMFY